MNVKAVIDTNVVVSGIFWKGAPFEILGAWQSGRFQMVVSRPILDEYRRVIEEMMRKKKLPAVESILALLEQASEIVEGSSLPKPICSDPDDDKFLAAACAARAKYVVSGDRALLRVQAYQGVQIVRPAEFLRGLASA